MYVNTAHASLNLSRGAVAQSLLKAGGPALQDECTKYNRAKGEVAVWDIATTGGAGLKCKHVIHTVGGHYDGAVSQQVKLHLMKLGIPQIFEWHMYTILCSSLI